MAYIAAWLGGLGAVAIDNLMEDAATAEISRSQVWQWLQGGAVDRATVERAIAEEAPADHPHGADARRLFTDLVFDGELADFLTLRALSRLDG